MNNTPFYRTTPRFWLVFILTILILCSISACGGGDSDLRDCPAVPADFMGPVKPCTDDSSS